MLTSWEYLDFACCWCCRCTAGAAATVFYLWDCLKTCPLDGDKFIKDKLGCITVRYMNSVIDFILQPMCQGLVCCTSRSKQASVLPTKCADLVPRQCTLAARCSSEEVWLIAEKKFHCTLCRCDSKESSIPKLKSSPTIIIILYHGKILEKITI